MSIAIINAFLILMLGYVYWRMPDAVHPTLPFGVRIPPHRAGDTAIAHVKRIYRTILVVLAAVGILAVWLLRSVETVYVALLPVAFIIIVYLDYYGAHRSLQAVKERGGWYEGQREAAVVDTNARIAPRRYPTGLLLIAIAVILITAAIGVARYPQLPTILATHFGQNGQPNGWMQKTPLSAFLLIWMQIGLTAIFAVIGYVLLQTRQELDPSAPEASAARHQAFQIAMVRVLLVLGILMNATFLLSSLQIWGIKLFGNGPRAVIVVLPVLIGVAYTFFVTLRIGQGGSRLPQPAEKPTGYVHRDDDRYWLFGRIYVNRDDRAIFVQKRFGIGWTLNFGHPVSWVALVMIVVLALSPTFLHAMAHR
ncbi:MAG: DUF5808 domain-containing protein [Thermaerobacter sp.]|nr:DUF5808 domain-containing protein [Thermaerobacter sp.]